MRLDREPGKTKIEIYDRRERVREREREIERERERERESERCIIRKTLQLFYIEGRTI